MHIEATLSIEREAIKICLTSKKYSMYIYQTLNFPCSETMIVLSTLFLVVTSTIERCASFKITSWCFIISPKAETEILTHYYSHKSIFFHDMTCPFVPKVFTQNHKEIVSHQIIKIVPNF